jgi:hypothetical protein
VTKEEMEGTGEVALKWEFSPKKKEEEEEEYFCKMSRLND